MARYRLFTTGYSGHDPNSFLELLREHGIDLVIDVRRIPMSRKKGFSRTALATFLEVHGLGYVHHRDLGVPQPLRQELRDGSCDLAAYLRRFRTYLRKQSDAIEEAYNLAIEKVCCLLCVEECSDECHRSVVAEELAGHNGKRIEIVHI